MRVAVTGGTGTLGRLVVRELELRGHDVRVLTRATGVDLRSGVGLAAALDGVEVVIDAANAGPRRRPAEAVLIGGTRRLLAAAAQAGVAHHVAVSIIGADRAPYAYARIKVAQEELVRGGDVPWTIVRAAQFHSLVDETLSAAARYGILPVAPFPLQPVDAGEVATALAHTAEADASGATTQFAGPDVLGVRELALEWRAATGRRRPLVPVPLPRELGRALQAGALTQRGAWRGRRTFGDYLARRYAPAPAALRAVGGMA
jgi:uncharacterized protein YbjT (DUF2867 family)